MQRITTTGNATIIAYDGKPVLTTDPWIAKRYKSSFLLALAGYGDADMINFFDEGGNFIVPPAAAKEPVGRALGEIARSIGAKTVIPFSSFHQYQRADSIWAQAYTTPLEAYAEGMSADLGYIAPFSSRQVARFPNPLRQQGLADIQALEVVVRVLLEMNRKPEMSRREKPGERDP